jgi:hypothetical protein
MPLHKSRELISKCGSNVTMQALEEALRISVTEFNDPFDSQGPGDLVNRFPQFDLEQLNRYQVILTKTEGCKLLEKLGVIGISNKYLNRYLNNTSYQKCFGRSVSKFNGRGNARLVFTYGEIIYFYKKQIGKCVPNSLTL